MSKHEVWFAVPSADPETARRNLPAWREQGYKVAVLQDKVRGEVPADRVMHVERYQGWSASVNLLCRHAVPKSAAIVVSGGDDMLPDPHQSAEQIARQFMERFPDGFGVMQPHGDDLLGCLQYCGSPWMGKAFVDRMYGGSGGLSDAYVHSWADAELMWVSKGLGAFWSRPDLSQYHDHFTRHGERAPEFWVKSYEENRRADMETFLVRSAMRFPGHEPVGGGVAYDPSVFTREYNGMAHSRWVQMVEPDLIGKYSAEKAMGRALARCAARGKTRVAIFGAGAHTKKVGGVLADPPVEILAIIDDGAEKQGKRLWGIPIMNRERARGLKLDAVVLSSDTIEEKLAASAAVFEADGAEVVRLYSGSEQSALAIGAGQQAVLAWPAFEDAGELAAFVGRASWMLAPIEGEVKSIAIPHRVGAERASVALAAAASAGERGTLAAASGRLLARVELIDVSDESALGRAVDEGDIVLAMGTSAGEPFDPPAQKARTGWGKMPRRVYRVDAAREPRALESWLKVSEDNTRWPARELEASRLAFKRMKESVCSDRACSAVVLGDEGAARRWLSGARAAGSVLVIDAGLVGCPRIVERLGATVMVSLEGRGLLEPGAEAAGRRGALLGALEASGSWLVVPQRQWLMWRALVPAGLVDRVVGVPVAPLAEPNVDLSVRLVAGEGGSAMATLLLPVALSLADVVTVAGEGSPMPGSGLWAIASASARAGKRLEWGEPAAGSGRETTGVARSLPAVA